MTTDTQPMAPTDAEIVALADETRTAEGGANGYILPISFARAVLAKWGTPPAVAGEPVAWMGMYDKTDLYYHKPPQADVVPLYATPQPTQSQAGAVPLTDEQIRAMLNKHPPEDVCGWSYRMGIDDAELHHGIKGGQHGTE